MLFSLGNCQSLPGATEVLAWNLEDPVASDAPNACCNTRVEINERIKMFLLLKSKKH